MTKKILCVTGARVRVRASPANWWSNPIFENVKRKTTASATEWNFWTCSKCAAKASKNKNFHVRNGARAGFARKRIVRFYCSLLQFEVDGVSSGMSYHELFYDLYFLSYSRLKLREGCQIPKKAIFRLFCSICTVLFLYFSL